MKPYTKGLQYAPRGLGSCALVSGENCRDTDVRIPASTFFHGNVIEIEAYAFRNQHLIKTVIIPEGVVSIGDYAFQGCDNLEGVILPSGLRHIGKGAFSSCTSLTSVIIPPNVKEIHENTFFQCSSLSSVIMPGVRYVGDSAFEACSSLHEISLGESLEVLMATAFKNSYVTQAGATHRGGLMYLSDWVIGMEEGLDAYTVSADAVGIAAGVFASAPFCIEKPNPAYDKAMYEFNMALEYDSPLPDISGIPPFLEETHPVNITYQGTLAKWETIRKPALEDTRIPVTVTALDGVLNTIL